MATVQTDPDINALIMQHANATAQQAYYDSMSRNEGERIALEKAKFAWQQQLDTAQMTGLWQGAPTQDAMRYYANTFGDWSSPEAGKKTLAAQQQEFAQGVTTAGLTGMYQGNQTQQAAKQAADIAARQAELTGYLQIPGQTGQGTQTLAGQQQQWSQGFQALQEANKNRQDYLQLLSGLRGPADYGQYLKVLGSTPGGLRDLVGAASGQYAPAQGAVYGQPVPVSMGSFMNSAATGMSQNYAPGQYAYPQAQPQGAPQLSAQYAQYGPVPQTPYQQSQAANQTALAQYDQRAQQGQGTDYQNYMAQASALPSPNQISPQAYNAMTTTQKQLMGGMYEQLGWNPQDVADVYKQSLPKYGSQSAQVGGIKLA